MEDIDERFHQGAVEVLAQWALWAVANDRAFLGEKILFMCGGKLSVEQVLAIADRVADRVIRPAEASVSAAVDVLAKERGKDG
jgi:hypothetical protein